jgi:glycosyltransferase involved in cell wall biosynthesis
LASEQSNRSVVLFTSDTYPPTYRTVDYSVVTRLPKAGYDITLVMRTTEIDRVERRELNGATVWTVPRPAATKNPLGLFMAYLEFRRSLQEAADSIARTQPVDICIARNEPMMASVARKLARAEGVPFIYWLSDLWPEELLIASKRGVNSTPTGSWLKGWFGQRIRNRELLAADGVIANSERMREFFTETYDIPASKQCVVHGGVPDEPVDETLAERAQALREQYGLEDKRIALYVGTLTLMRHPQIYVEMMPEVLEAVPDAHLVIVGDGPRGDEIEILRERARELGVEEHVTLTGRVTWEKAQVFIAAADVGLCALELHIVYDCSAPLKVMEYMFGQLPVVCTDVPASTVLVEAADAGRIVDFDADAFADATIDLLQMSEEERAQMGVRGREEVISSVSYETMAERLRVFLDRWCR